MDKLIEYEIQTKKLELIVKNRTIFSKLFKPFNLIVEAEKLMRMNPILYFKEQLRDQNKFRDYLCFEDTEGFDDILKFNIKIERTERILKYLKSLTN